MKYRIKVLVVLFSVLIFLTGTGVTNASTLKVGQVAWDLGDIFFRAVQDGTELTLDVLAEKEGFSYERYLRGSSNPGEQINLMETMLGRGIDIGVFCPIDSKLIGPVKQFNNSNVPVICNNVAILGGKNTFVAFDNIIAGETTAKALIEIFKARYGPEPEDWAKAGGVIVEVTGDLAMQIAIDRRAGFHNVLKPIVEKTAGLELVSVEGKFQADLAYKRMTDLLTKHGERIIGTYTHGDTMTIAGVWPALKAKGLGYKKEEANHIPMVCIDGTPEALKLVREGIIDSITIQDAFGEGVVVGHLAYDIWKESEEKAIAQVGDVLYQDVLPLIMELHPEEFTQQELATGAKPVWAPVHVVAGKTPAGTWDGVWYRTNSTITVPGDYPADSKLLWGNFWIFLRDGKWPWDK